MRITWRTALNGASSYERMVICRLERYAQNLHLQEAVRALCHDSPIGLCDCSELQARASLRRWGRIQGRTFVEFSLSTTGPIPNSTARYCFNRL
jgi:hypothetical protein